MFASRLCVVALFVAACSKSSGVAPSDAEILWDRWGVPHVFAENEPALFRGFGWAQAQSHGDLLLRLYGQARGRAAEYWGAEFVDSDRWVWTVGIPERARAWYDAQEPTFRACLDAFAAGINAYGRDHADELDAAARVVLPVSGVDVLAHAHRVLHFTFVANPGMVGGSLAPSGGSNAWAIAPSHSASGRALLLANPHLPWSDLFLFFEAHLVAPGVDVSGAALVGFPTLGIGFNEHLGWTHTVNAQDGVDLFELSRDGEGYRWNGAMRPFGVVKHTLRVRRDNGGFDERALEIKNSVAGPIVGGEESKPLALRVVGLDRPDSLRQWWDMARAKDLAEFERALARMQLPVFSVLYADRAGHVLYTFGGQSPKRPANVADGSKPVRAESDDVLWSELQPYADLPRVSDPPNGWVQNANDPPWSSTYPRVLDPKNFPASLASGSVSLRAQRSIEMLRADDSISLDELVTYKHSTRVELADRLLDDLLPLAAASDNPRVRKAGEVLAAWDRATDAKSRGAVLFATWVQKYGASGSFYAQRWDPERPLETPDGLANPIGATLALDAALTALEKQGVAPDVAWGAWYRLRGGDHDFPCSGGMESLGIFRAFEFAADRDGKKHVVAGDSFVAAIEFSDPPRGLGVQPYGNASQASSPHRFDQLELAAAGKLRPMLRERTAIEAELEHREFVPER
ncbi:MAG: penicillin acylase family protein [Planctomycetes bacterium]|nr:penicillin acylase family protein [Planctomycetota bacterium]